MALSKKKSRPITVEGQTFRYIVSTGHRLDAGLFPLNITAQHQNGIGAKLTVHGLTTRDFWLDFANGPRGSDEYLMLKPRHIEKLIRLGMQQGWQPEDAGPPFMINVSKEDINERAGHV